MRNTILPTLEHIALVKTSTILWNQDDVRAQISELNFDLSSLRIMPSAREWYQVDRKEWRAIQKKIKEKIATLYIPEVLKSKLIDIIKPIGMEIAIWRHSHENFLTNPKFINESLKKLCWTSLGTVDKRQTAKLLIGDGTLDITKRYELACIYCLENDIFTLWDIIAENEKRSFYSGNPQKFNQHVLVVLWTCNIIGGIDRLNDMMQRLRRNRTPYQFAFEYAAMGGNKAAAEFFLQKLTAEQVKESLVYAASLVARRRCISDRCQIDFPKEYSEVLCFLLSQMTEEQFDGVLKSGSYAVLRCLLDWPWQGFFLKIASRVYSYLTSREFASLLYLIINDKICPGYCDYDYSTLFQDFWQQSPLEHRRYVIHICMVQHEWSVITDLLRIEDKRSFLTVIKDATEEEREKIAFQGLDWKRLFCQAKWDLLAFFLRVCLPSKSSMMRFREEKKTKLTTLSDNSKRSIWNYFCNIIDELIKDFDRKGRRTSEHRLSKRRRLYTN